MSRCLDDGRLERLNRGAAGLLRGWWRRRHLRGCPHCRARWEELRRDEEFVSRFRALPVPGPDAEEDKT